MSSLRGYAFAVPLVALVVVACGGGGTTPVDGGSDDGTVTPKDGSSNMDSSMDGSNMDSSSTDSSMDGSGDSALDGGIGCTTPANCGMGQVCCGTMSLGSGQFPMCMVNNYSTMCVAPQTCPTTFALMCNSMQKVRGCSNNTHCTEMAYNKCCTFMMNMQSVSFCANNTIAMFGGGTCQ